ncbi:MAG: hypothetical protein AAGA60_11110 [Cyanobacteria bacterium P01_E01_bin.42]
MLSSLCSCVNSVPVYYNFTIASYRDRQQAPIAIAPSPYSS